MLIHTYGSRLRIGHDRCSDEDSNLAPFTNEFKNVTGEVKRILYSGNACYHSVLNLLSSRLLSKNVKIRIYKTVILPVVLYGTETWSLTLREEHR
jgi:hypothetical protein